MRLNDSVLLLSLSVVALAGCSSSSGGGTGGVGGGGGGGYAGTGGGGGAGAMGGSSPDGGTDASVSDGSVAGKGGGGGAGGAGGGAAPVARGEYLVKSVLGCSGCHTPSVNGAPDMTKFLGGNDCFTKDSATGDCLASANLTNDATGIKNLTDQEVIDAFRKGIDPEPTDAGARYLFSQMPYYQFANLTDDDAEAIVAYLRSVPPVSHTPGPNGASFATQPTSPQWLPAALANFPAPAADAGAGAGLTNGKYLASLMCATCHTVNTAATSPLQIDVTKAFQGGKVATTRITVPATGAGGAGGAGGASAPGGAGGAGGAGATMTVTKMIQSSNLTPDATGLAGWTVQQIVTAIKMGTDEKGRTICSPMRTYPTLKNEDATDIANYLKAIPAVNHAITMTCE